MSQEQRADHARAIAPGPAADIHSGAGVRHGVQKFSHEMRKDSPVTPSVDRRIADPETHLTEFEICAVFGERIGHTNPWGSTTPGSGTPLRSAGHPAKDRCPTGQVPGGNPPKSRVLKDHVAWQLAHYPVKFSPGERAQHSVRECWRNRAPLSRYGGSFSHTTSQVASSNSRRFHRNAGQAQITIVNPRRWCKNLVKSARKTLSSLPASTGLPHGTRRALRTIF